MFMEYTAVLFAFVFSTLLVVQVAQLQPASSFQKLQLKACFTAISTISIRTSRYVGKRRR